MSRCALRKGKPMRHLPDFCDACEPYQRRSARGQMCCHRRHGRRTPFLLQTFPGQRRLRCSDMSAPNE